MLLSETFTTTRPKETFDAVFGRLKSGRKVEEDIADLIRERARIEESYARELTKLSKKSLNGSTGNVSSSSIDASGVADGLSAGELWTLLVTAAADTSQVHSLLAANLLEKVEKGMRSWGDSDADWANLKTSESDVGKLTRDYEDKLSKYGKIKAKTDKDQLKAKGKKDVKSEQRLEAAQVALIEIKSQLLSEGIASMDKLQALDLKRLTALKSHLSTFGEIMADTLRKETSVNDGVVASIMSFDPESDLNKFCEAKGNMALEVQDSANGVLAVAGATVNRTNSVMTAGSTDAKQVTGPPTTATNASPAPKTVDVVSSLVDEDGFTIPKGRDGWFSQAPADPSEGDADGLSESSSAAAAANRLKIAIRKEAIVEDSSQAEKYLSTLATTLHASVNLKSAIKSKDRRRTKGSMIKDGGEDDIASLNESIEAGIIKAASPSSIQSSTVGGITLESALPSANSVPATPLQPPADDKLISMSFPNTPLAGQSSSVNMFFNKGTALMDDIFGDSTPSSTNYTPLVPASMISGSKQPQFFGASDGISEALNTPPQHEQQQPLKKQQQQRINVHITETVNALFADGEVKKILVSGDVEFQRDGDNDGEGTSPSVAAVVPVQFRWKSGSKIEKVVPNLNILTRIAGLDGTSGAGSETSFEVRTAELSSRERTCVLKYSCFAVEDVAPVWVTAVWREVDDGTAMNLLVSVEPNEAVCGAIKGVMVVGLSVMASFERSGSVGAGAGTGVLMKPEGSWTDKVVVWKVDGTVFDSAGTPAEPFKFLAKIDGRGIRPGMVVFKFTVQGLVSDAGIEAVDLNKLGMDVKTRMCVAGKYGVQAPIPAPSSSSSTVQAL